MGEPEKAALREEANGEFGDGSDGYFVAQGCRSPSDLRDQRDIFPIVQKGQKTCTICFHFGFFFTWSHITLEG